MKKQEISFCDMFCGNQIKTLEEGKDDFIIFRADGAVSYQLAASADDGIMQVTHVFRGNDLLPSTFYQIYLLSRFKLIQKPLITKNKTDAEAKQNINLPTVPKKYPECKLKTAL